MTLLETMHAGRVEPEYVLVQGRSNWFLTFVGREDDLEGMTPKEWTRDRQIHVPDCSLRAYETTWSAVMAKTCVAEGLIRP